MPFLRIMWVVTAEIYQTAIRPILTALRKGWEMTTCETEGCDNIAQLTVTKTLRVTPTVETQSKKVCTDCGPEMQALYGWEILGRYDWSVVIG